MYHLFKILNIVCLFSGAYYAYTDNYTKATYFLVEAFYMEFMCYTIEEKK